MAVPIPRRRSSMAGGEAGQVTGTPDKDYNIIWFTEQCLSNVLRLEQYVQDAERAGDSELADFFRRAQGAPPFFRPRGGPRPKGGRGGQGAPEAAAGRRAPPPTTPGPRLPAVPGV